MKARGFSLIELTVVLLIVSAVSAIAVVHLGGLTGRAEAEDAVSRIAHVLGLAREMASRGGEPLSVRIRHDGRRMEILSASGEELGGGATLPGRWRIAAVTIDGRASAGDGTVVPVSPQGLSPTWLMEIVDPRGRRHWVLAAGLSGQVLGMSNREKAQAILGAVEGDDAD